MTPKEINELAKEIYKINLDNGFDNDKESDEHCYMLIITEIAEMVEADRKNRYADVRDFEDAIKAIEESKYTSEEKDYFFKHAFETRIKDTVEDEFADIMIRLLDFITVRNIEYEEIHYEILYFNNISNYKVSELGYLIVDSLMSNSIAYTIQLVIKTTKALNINLWWHVRQKVKYNKLRGYKHGNKKY